MVKLMRRWIKEIFCRVAGPGAACTYRHLTKRAGPAEQAGIGDVGFSVSLGCGQLCFEFDRGRSHRVLTCGFPYFVQALACYLSASRTILWFIWLGVRKGPSYVRLLNHNLPGCLWKAVSLVHSGQIQLRSQLLFTANTSENNLQFLGWLTLMLRGRRGARSSVERVRCCSLRWLKPYLSYSISSYCSYSKCSL